MFTLTSTAERGFNSLVKVNPPFDFLTSSLKLSTSVSTGTCFSGTVGGLNGADYTAENRYNWGLFSYFTTYCFLPASVSRILENSAKILTLLRLIGFHPIRAERRG
jgi:hypothetical protein